MRKTSSCCFSKYITQFSNYFKNAQRNLPRYGFAFKLPITPRRRTWRDMTLADRNTPRTSFISPAINRIVFIHFITQAILVFLSLNNTNKTFQTQSAKTNFKKKRKGKEIEKSTMQYPKTVGGGGGGRSGSVYVYGRMRDKRWEERLSPAWSQSMGQRRNPITNFLFKPRFLIYFF